MCSLLLLLRASRESLCPSKTKLSSMTQTGIIRPSIPWISYGLSHCNRPFCVLGSEWNWVWGFKSCVGVLGFFLPASRYTSSSDSSCNLSGIKYVASAVSVSYCWDGSGDRMDACINEEMAMNRVSIQAWVMSPIGWDSKTKASLWGVYCNKALECTKTGLL